MRDEGGGGSNVLMPERSSQLCERACGGVGKASFQSTSLARVFY